MCRKTIISFITLATYCIISLSLAIIFIGLALAANLSLFGVSNAVPFLLLAILLIFTPWFLLVYNRNRFNSIKDCLSKNPCLQLWNSLYNLYRSTITSMIIAVTACIIALSPASIPFWGAYAIYIGIGLTVTALTLMVLFRANVVQIKNCLKI